jgi:flagellar basal body-associated protein FliL
MDPDQDDNSEYNAENEGNKDEDQLAASEDIELPLTKRRRPVAIILILVLVILLVGAGLIVRFTNSGIFGTVLKPTPTILPGENLFLYYDIAIMGQCFSGWTYSQFAAASRRYTAYVIAR